MSDRDRALIRTLGVSVAHVADVIGKSRQAVYRGINASQDDYLKPADLVNLLVSCRETDAQLYAIARTAICDSYAGVAAAVLSGVEQGQEKGFDPDVPGEYWLICGDFRAFRTSSPMCSSQLEALGGSGRSQVKLFVNQQDFKTALRFAGKYEEDRMQVAICITNLSIYPSILLRMDEDDNIDLFGPSDTGFTPLSRQEGTRLRALFQEREKGALQSVNRDVSLVGEDSDLIPLHQH